MDTGRVVVIMSCWFSLSLITSVYMVVFAGKLGDALFGVFLPIGLLILVGLAVTFFLTSSSEQEENLHK